MIKSAIAAALAPLQTSIDALTLKVTTCERRQGRSSEVSALQADVASLRRDVDYLKSIDFNDLMIATEDRDAPGEAAAADADAETDEELTAAKEEQNIFGNLSDLVGTFVHPVIQASHAKTSTTASTRPSIAALDVTTPSTDGHYRLQLRVLMPRQEERPHI
uniref:Polyprotein protein n=1 Tax=Solanum tuberosum TaxID=4113 RepID=M1DQR7_SOLTU